MTTRRGRSSGSGDPGTRAWRDRIQGIKQELDANNRRLIRTLEEQDTARAEEVRSLVELADSLRIEELLAYMNDILLDGLGVVERTLHWDEVEALGDEEDDLEYDDEDEEDGDDEEDDDFYLSATLSVTLTWKEAGRLQVRVDIQEDDGEIRVDANGTLIDPPTARNLQNGLVRAFREQMDENYGKFEEES